MERLFTTEPNFYLLPIKLLITFMKYFSRLLKIHDFINYIENDPIIANFLINFEEIKFIGL